MFSEWLNSMKVFSHMNKELHYNICRKYFWQVLQTRLSCSENLAPFKDLVAIMNHTAVPVGAAGC